MVQVVENRADIEGRVLALENDSGRPGHCRVTVDVGAARSVEGYPNLFAETSGKPLDIFLPHEHAPRVGASVSLRIRRAGPATVFGEPR